MFIYQNTSNVILSSTHKTSFCLTNLLQELFRTNQVIQKEHRQLEEDFVGAKFYCLHALADGNWCIQIREKMTEFSSVVLPTPSSFFIVYPLKQHMGTTAAGWMPFLSSNWMELNALTLITHRPHSFLDPLIDSVKVLRPTRHKIGHFGDVPQANLLALYGKTKPNKTKERIHQSKEMYYDTE